MAFFTTLPSRGFISDPVSSVVGLSPVLRSILHIGLVTVSEKRKVRLGHTLHRGYQRLNGSIGVRS